MDYRKWAEMQQIPSNPNPSTDLYAQIYNARHSSSYAHHPYYPHQTRDPSLEDPRTVLKRLETPSSLYEAGLEAGLRRPGIDSYAAINSYPSSLAGLKGHEALTYGHQAAQISPLSAASYYHDTGAVAQKWAAKEAIRQFGADPAGFVAAGIRSANGTEPLLAANPNPLPRSNAKIRRPPFNKASRRGPKKTKVVQSAWCEICKIDCNSKDVLDQHKLGKKHKKNLERLEGSKEEASSPGAAAAPVVKNLSIGPKENQAADKGKNVCMLQTKKKVASLSPGDDLETKKRRIMLGSVTANDVRVCTICNVVCNSETVFSHHIAGQKHANMVKKQAAEAATPGP